MKLPTRAGAETLWREDHLYDLVGVLDFNLRPRVIGRGSAIFFHLAHDGLQPTAGCIALRAADMRRLQHRLAARAKIVVGGLRRPVTARQKLQTPVERK
jgi:L,D-peptidoglycan transpeptidase YkuD (ErfK/YbiS/YcfS/YnhG family)